MEKIVHIDVDGRNVRFSIDKVKPYLRERGSSTAEDVVPTPAIESAAETTDRGDIIQDLRRIMDENNGGEVEPSPFGTSSTDILQTEVVDDHDPRSQSEMFRTAKEREICGLLSRKPFQAVHINTVPREANVLGGRFVLTLKGSETSEEKPKARYVVQGHKDAEKAFVVHNLPTVQQRSIRVLVSLAAVKGFMIFSDDVSQAYLQSDEQLSWEVYIRPKQEDMPFFSMTKDNLLKLLRPLYGLCDSGDYWLSTIHRYIRKKLGFLPFRGDPSVYLADKKDGAFGMFAVYVDDTLGTGNEAFASLTSQMSRDFESKPRTWNILDFFGMNISRSEAGFIEIQQFEYVSKMNLVPEDASFALFRSCRAALAWVTHSRPDLCFAVNQAVQVTETHFDINDVRSLNKAIQFAKKSQISLRFGMLHETSLHIRVYADASFGTNRDFTSQIGVIILLCDKNNHSHILDYSLRLGSLFCYVTK